MKKFVLEETDNTLVYTKLNDEGKLVVYVEKVIKFCGDCFNHKFEADPDPTDWFAMDEKLICRKTQKKCKVV